MPIYRYHCKHCNKIYEPLQTVKQMEEEGFQCPECKRKTKLKPSSFSFKFDFRPGYDAGLGQYIDTAKQREQVMREQGARRIRD